MRCLLVVLIFLSGFLPDADAASRANRIVFHGVGYEFKASETELLDCKYGQANVGRGPGKCFNGAGPMPLPNFLYVKWRDKATEQVYEERVDLKRRLPTPRKMEGATVYWVVEDNQLYVYLIPDGGDSFRPVPSAIADRRTSRPMARPSTTIWMSKPCKGNALTCVPRLAWNHLPGNADATETGTDPRSRGQYPSDQRIGKAKATLDAVNERYSGSSRGAEMTKRMHHYLAARLAQGTAIPNPAQALGLINQEMGRGGIAD